MSEEWQTTKASLEKIKEKLQERKGARDQLLKTRKADEVLCSTARAEQLDNYEASVFLQAQSFDLRNQAMKYIENMITPALKAVYGPRFRVQFRTFDEKKKDGVLNFKMELCVGSPLGEIEHLVNPRNAKGGGLMETVATAFRLAALDIKKYGGPVVLDEVFRMISNDHKIEFAAQLLSDIATSTGRQFIFSTHMGETFGPIADKIIWVSLVDGVSSFKEVSPEELNQLLAEANEEAKKLATIDLEKSK